MLNLDYFIIETPTGFPWQHVRRELVRQLLDRISQVNSVQITITFNAIRDPAKDVVKHTASVQYLNQRGSIITFHKLKEASLEEL